MGTFVGAATAPAVSSTFNPVPAGLRNAPPAVSSTFTPVLAELNGTLPKFKSKMCDFWIQTGTCKKGEACDFAHSEHKLRDPPTSVQAVSPSYQPAHPPGVAA